MIKNFLMVLLLGCAAMSATAQDFARGADVSWCTEMEADGRKFYNAQGTETEMMALMKEIGMTAIRLRVWVNPQQYGYGAWSDKADVVAKAKRAHAQGLDLMIDFHYSDFFADPGTQKTPMDWVNLTKEELKTSMAEHTKDVLQALKDEGIEPKWVQVGNETNNGMLHPTGQIEWSKSGSARYANYVDVSNAGYDAVKAVFPNAYVIVHLGNTKDVLWFYKEFKAAGGKFDMIGLSHYPTEAQWNSTATDAAYSNVNAAKNVRQAITDFNVPVMICETGFNVSKPELASQVMKDLFDRMTVISRCAGIFYWEPEVYGWWKPAYYNTIGWNAYGMGAFSSNGRPTAALDAFHGNGDENDIHTMEAEINGGVTSIYTLAGIEQTTADINALPSGIYLISNGGKMRKIMKH